MDWLMKRPQHEPQREQQQGEHRPRRRRGSVEDLDLSLAQVEHRYHHHWSSPTTAEEQQAPSPPTVVLPSKKKSPRKPRRKAATRRVLEEQSQQPDDEEETKEKADQVESSSSSSIMSSHPWRTDLAFKKHVRGKQQQQPPTSMEDTASSLSRYRTSYRTLLQQRKQVFDTITIAEEQEKNESNAGIHNREQSFDDEEEEEEQQEASDSFPQQQQAQQQPSSSWIHLDLPPLAHARRLQQQQQQQQQQQLQPQDDAVSLGMSIQSSVNRRAIRTLLQQEMKQRVQQIYTGHFYCVEGLSETESQQRTSRPGTKHGRPLDHPIFSPKYRRLQDDLVERLKDVYTGDHYIIEAQGGMTLAKQESIDRDVHQQYYSQVMDEFQERLRLVRENGVETGFSCWDYDDDDDDDECDDYSCDSVEGPHQHQSSSPSNLPRLDIMVRSHDDGDDEEVPHDEQQTDQLEPSITTVMNTPLHHRKQPRSKDVVAVEHLEEPTNSLTDDEEEDDDMTELSAHGKHPVVRSQQQPQAAALPESTAKSQPQHQDDDDDDDEWDEYTIATTATEQESKRKVLLDHDFSKSRMFSDFQLDPASTSAKKQAPSSSRQSAADGEESEWDEYTIQSSVADGKKKSAAVADDDESEWDEYTIQDSVVASQAQPQHLMAHSRMFSDFKPESSSSQIPKQQQAAVDDDDDGEWDEYTIHSEAVSSGALRPAAAAVPKPSDDDDGEEWDEYTIQDPVIPAPIDDKIKSLLARSAAARSKTSPTEGSPRSSPPAARSNSDGDDEEEWEEHTVQESVSPPSRSAQQLNHHTSSRSAMFSSDPSPSPSKNNKAMAMTTPTSHQSSPSSTLPSPRVTTDDNGDEWEEYTIQETVVSAKKETKKPAAAAIVDTSAFGHSRMFSNFDPQASNNDFDEVTMDDDEVTTEQYIDCPCDQSVVSAFTMEPGLMQHEEALNRRAAGGYGYGMSSSAGGYFDPKSPKSNSQGGTRTAPTCDTTNSADGESSAGRLSRNNNKASASATGTRSVASYCSATSGTSAGGGSRSSSIGNNPYHANSKRIAELLRRDIWSKKVDVVHQALQELLLDAAQGPTCCARIVRYGGPLAIMCAMEANPNHIGIQIAACGTMEQLATAGCSGSSVVDCTGSNSSVGVEESSANGSAAANHRVTLGEVGAVQSVVTAMKADLDHIELQRVACSALMNLTQHGALNEVTLEGAVETVVKSLTKHTDDPTIQEMAFLSLGNLCMENKTRLQELSDVKGLATMTMALQRPWKNPSEKQGAISTLSMLLRCTAEYCDDLLYVNDT